MEIFNPYVPRPNLTTHKIMPDNQETPIHHLPQWITPAEYFYRRNHFPYPMLTQQFFFLPVSGEVGRPYFFSYQQLLSMPSKTVTMVLECSGNKRSYFNPKVYGEQWQDGAISQGVWRGVPLYYLLSLVGIKPSAQEVVLEAQDFGKRTDMEGIFPFARSLPLNKALHPDTLIAYELNGRPIPFEHGYPLRLIVPQWYAMASVKWMKRITVINHAFTGPFQAVDYVYYPHREDDLEKKPVTTINIASIIQQPLNHSLLDTGIHEIFGIAWTGEGTVTEVDISFDEGQSWSRTKLQHLLKAPYSWSFWSYTWNVTKKGEYTIRCRAKDSRGRIQPPEAWWNRKGYGYNGIYTIRVKVE